MVEKKWIDEDIYSIQGIESTAQLADFYKYVVDNNIQKYVGITTEGVKFKYNAVTQKAVPLDGSESFAINPNYHKIDITPIEEIVAETKLEPSLEQVKEPEIVSESVNVVEEKPIQTQQPEQTINDTNDSDKIVQYEMDIKQLQEKVKDLTTDLQLAEEKVKFAESQLESVKAHSAELQDIINTKDIEIEQLNLTRTEELPLTLDMLIVKLEELGFEAYLKKIK